MNVFVKRMNIFQMNKKIESRNFFFNSLVSVHVQRTSLQWHVGAMTLPVEGTRRVEAVDVGAAAPRALQLRRHGPHVVWVATTTCMWNAYLFIAHGRVPHDFFRTWKSSLFGEASSLASVCLCGWSFLWHYGVLEWAWPFCFGFS